MSGRFVATATAALVIGAASVAFANTLPKTATPLSADEVTKLYSGKTKVFPKSSFFFASDDTMKGVYTDGSKTLPANGKWVVSNNELCLTTSKQGKDGKDCWKWWKDGDTLYALWSTRSYGPKVDAQNDYSSDESAHLHDGDLVGDKYTQAGGK